MKANEAEYQRRILSCREIARTWARLSLFKGLVLAIPFHVCAAQDRTESCEVRHPVTDAWFTGPMLANTAATAPRGHFLIEPYLYDVATQASYGSNGVRHSVPSENSYGSLTYLIYGITDTTGVGVIPSFGYNVPSQGPSNARPGIGDVTIQVQRRLTQFRPCRWTPIISLAVQETLPTGKYDKLGNRSADGLGAGAYTTTPEFLSQMYFWMPNRRILRVRFNASDAFSRSVDLQDASVYGTTAGFRGTAKPGNSLYVDISAEYSLTRSWVLALDVTYRNTANTRVTGYYLQSSSVRGAPPIVETNSGSSQAYGLAPAIEYSWKPWIGVLVGVRMIPAGRNTDETITPAVAINIVH